MARVYTTPGYIARLYHPLSVLSFDGYGNNAGINLTPEYFTVGDDGTVFFSQPYEHIVRALHPSGEVFTIGGQRGVPGHMDGPVRSIATFDTPTLLAYDKLSGTGGGNGVLYVYMDFMIRRIDQVAGMVSTILGSTAKCSSFEAVQCDFPILLLQQLDGMYFTLQNDMPHLLITSKRSCSLRLINVNDATLATLWDGCGPLGSIHDAFYVDNTTTYITSEEDGFLKTASGVLEQPNLTPLLPNLGRQALPLDGVYSEYGVSHVVSASLYLANRPNNTDQFVFIDHGALRVLQHSPSLQKTIVGTFVQFADGPRQPPVWALPTNRYSFAYDGYLHVETDGFNNIYLTNSDFVGLDMYDSVWPFPSPHSSFLYMIYSTPPLSPRNFNNVGSTDTSLHFSWLPGSHMAMTVGFNVTIERYTPTPETKYFLTTNASLLVTDLLPNKDYYILIRAYNQFGSSDVLDNFLWTSPVRFLSQPPISSIIVRNDLASPTSLLISLEMPITPFYSYYNATITGHDLEIQDRIDTSIVVFLNNTSNTTLINMYPMTTYGFRARTHYTFIIDHGDDTLTSSSDWSPWVFETTGAYVKPLYGEEYEDLDERFPSSCSDCLHQVVYDEWSNTTFLIEDNIIYKILSSNDRCVVAGNSSFQYYLSDNRRNVSAHQISFSDVRGISYSHKWRSLFILDTYKQCVQRIALGAGDVCSDGNNMVSTYVGLCDPHQSKRRSEGSNDHDDFDYDNNNYDNVVDGANIDIELHHRRGRNIKRGLDPADPTPLYRLDIILDGPSGLAMMMNEAGGVNNNGTSSSIMFIVDNIEARDNLKRVTGQPSSIVLMVDMVSGNISFLYQFSRRLLPHEGIFWSSSFRSLMVISSATNDTTPTLYDSKNMWTIRHFVNGPDGKPSPQLGLSPLIISATYERRISNDMIWGLSGVYSPRSSFIPLGPIIGMTVHPTRKVLYILQEILRETSDDGNETPVTSLLMFDLDRGMYGLVGRTVMYDRDLSFQYGKNFNRFSFLSSQYDSDAFHVGLQNTLTISTGGSSDISSSSTSPQNHLYFYDYKFKALQWDDVPYIDGGAFTLTLVSWNYTHIMLRWNAPSYYYLVRNYNVSTSLVERRSSSEALVPGGGSRIYEDEEGRPAPSSSMTISLAIPEDESRYGAVTWRSTVYGLFSENNTIMTSNSVYLVVLRPMLEDVEYVILSSPPALRSDNNKIVLSGFYLALYDYSESNLYSPALSGDFAVYTSQGRLDCDDIRIPPRKRDIQAYEQVECYVSSKITYEEEEVFFSLFDVNGGMIMSNKLYFSGGGEGGGSNEGNSTVIPPINNNNSTNNNNDTANNDPRLQIVPVDVILRPTNNSYEVPLFNGFNQTSIIVEIPPSLFGSRYGNLTFTLSVRPGNESLRRGFNTSMIDLTLHPSSSSSSLSNFTSSSRFNAPVAITFIMPSHHYQSQFNNASCLAYYHEGTREWKCEDRAPTILLLWDSPPTKQQIAIRGLTWHFTTFAILLNPSAVTRDQDQSRPPMETTAAGDTSDPNNISPSAVAAVVVVVCVVVMAGVAAAIVWEMRRRKRGGGKKSLSSSRQASMVLMNNMSTSQ
eukprot:TRINITY_DN2834_c0_g1_i2.p1 TRINITY_DN2834_c0_g1~~TRINITY_DN2834_c0_g1_i2.p1  ORF type:complete len:1701 (+),score=235.28 TRINITY_DN2834_c0_g1_i2:355-5103(+)